MDFALIDVTFFIISMALFLIILDGHICSVILDGTVARVVGFVNLTLHIGMFVCLMLSRVPLEFLVLAFMASTFCYCLAFYLRYRIDMRREAASVKADAEANTPADVSAEESASVGGDTDGELGGVLKIMMGRDESV